MAGFCRRRTSFCSEERVAGIAADASDWRAVRRVVASGGSILPTRVTRSTTGGTERNER